MSNKKNQPKESIRLRGRVLKDGTTSLYLDYYRDGSRKYEYLKLYLLPETSKEAKAKNKETRAFAEAVLAKRIVEMRNGEFGFTQHAKELRFYDYYVNLCNKKKGKNPNKEGRGNKGNWKSALVHLKIYDPNLERLTFAQITPQWIEGFKHYLEYDALAWAANYSRTIEGKKLSKITARHYMVKVRSAIKSAILDGLLPANTLSNIKNIDDVETERNYLTIEELKLMIDHPCACSIVYRAFIFSCFTGLRRSDIINLKWSDVSEVNGYTRLTFKQQKTGGLEYLDITSQAVPLMGERQPGDAPVFKGMYSASGANHVVNSWCRELGIKKKITFHCARHTFATMMLGLGNDLYTVSKLLGHRDITTTQVYAKIMDKNKQAAVDSIPKMFGE